MVMLDANMILRYLLNDNQEMADRAERYLEDGDVIVTIEVVAEVVYVLKATSKNPVFANNTSQRTLVLQGFPK